MADQDYDDELAELQRERDARQHYRRKLLAHPDCRDPDHPGCENCMNDDDDS